MADSRYVVARHRPWRAAAAVLMALGTLLTAVVLAYAYGRAKVSAEYVAARSERDVLGESLAGYVAENEELRRRVAILDRASQVDKRAKAAVEKYVIGLQDEIYGLKEEVAFYRGIVSSRRGKGLNIQSFTVRPGNGVGDYRYQLVLTRDMKSDKVVSGTVSMAVTGEQGGRARRLSDGELQYGQDRRIQFQFKYFQKIEGSIILPADFAPQRVVVQVIVSGARDAVTEKTFDWPRPIG